MRTDAILHAWNAISKSSQWMTGDVLEVIKERGKGLENVFIIASMAEDATDGDLLNGLPFGNIFEFKSGAVPDVLEDAFGDVFGFFN